MTDSRLDSRGPADAGRDACAGCPVASGRREFLQRVLAAGTAALVAAVGLPGAAAALPVRLAAALARAGDTRTYAIPPEDGVQIDRDAQVILVRWQGAVYAFNLSCPHQNTALRWMEAAHRFQCPKHKSQYQPDGEFITGRATRGMDRLGIRRDGSTVVVDLDALHKQDDDPAGWAAAVVRLA
jgi:nitrite reductase/ring-hydroxylating ferredoxin subunit